MATRNKWMLLHDKVQNVFTPEAPITGKPYEIPGYGGSLHLLSEVKRASILEKHGESHSWSWRFRNPLMEPYAIMYGLSMPYLRGFV